MNFFDTIVSYLESIWQFFLNMLQSLSTLVMALSAATELPFTLTAIAPSFLAASVSAVSGIAIVKILLGREQG